MAARMTGRYHAPAVDRALDILEFLGRHGAATIPAVAAAVGQPRSTAYAVMTTMADRGYVERLDNGQYRLGTRLIHLGRAVLSGLSLRHIARPVMERLVAETHETCNLGLLSGEEVVYIDIVDSPHFVKLNSAVGAACAVYCSALGKVLLACKEPHEVDEILSRTKWVRFTANTITDSAALKEQLAVVRARDYAEDNEELDSGVRCVAAPIRDHTGQVISAISLSGPITRIPPQRVPFLAAILQEAGAAVSVRLGYRIPAPPV